MKLAAAVIVYHPSEATIDNLKTYYKYFDTIFVFDNTEKESWLKAGLSSFEKVQYYHDFKNEGISKRLNTACKAALRREFEWLLTMDQDSHFNEDTISNYLNCFYNYQNKTNVAAFGPRYHGEIQSRGGQCDQAEVEYLITSGMLLNLQLFNAIGDFDEALFIDGVDHDYCIRAKLARCSIIEFSNIYLLHQLGKAVFRSSLKTLFLIKKQKIVHSPLRCYYMYRNLLYLEKKYEELGKEFPEELRRHLIARIKTSAFYGGKLLKVIKYINAAKEDFKNNRMGKKLIE